MNTSQRGVDKLRNTSYKGVVNITAKPDPKSISRGHWARFIFISGRLCIDFTQTGGETEQRAYWERFHQPSDLADWFSESPLQLEGIQVRPEEFEVALSLREAIWRVAQAIRQGETLLTEDIDMINRAASAPDLPPQLVRNSSDTTWHSPATATAALSTIARDAIDLFSGELRSRIRVCENPNCGLMFVDASRPGKRRWCLMKRCGTMQKNSRRYHKD
ncbi:MAG: zf-CGNR multi-domain protein [Chloroflexi bacterium]|nr:MAG: zf-CGNR multi-domain protein [Chloroflexota bacterium]RPI96914.1 MAG: zf-CGNR multi-domain protein [Chloroflexota bacterium]